MVEILATPSDLRREEARRRNARSEEFEVPISGQAGDRLAADPPRGPFGGGQRIGGAGAEEDNLRARIDVLLGCLGTGQADGPGVAVALRTALGQAREALKQGRLGLALHIVDLVRGC